MCASIEFFIVPNAGDSQPVSDLIAGILGSDTFQSREGPRTPPQPVPRGS
jgi:hypothetical protein